MKKIMLRKILVSKEELNDINFERLKKIDKHKNTLIDSDIEAVIQRFSVKKVFLEISQNSQENTCARVSFLITLLA